MINFLDPTLDFESVNKSERFNKTKRTSTQIDCVVCNNFCRINLSAFLKLRLPLHTIFHPNHRQISCTIFVPLRNWVSLAVNHPVRVYFERPALSTLNFLHFKRDGFSNAALAKVRRKFATPNFACRSSQSFLVILDRGSHSLIQRQDNRARRS